MIRKDILELKRRFKKDECTFNKLCACYVNGDKKILLTFRETFLNLPDEEFFKYLEIAKKVLSGNIGNNLLELNFPLNENMENEKQAFLMKLKKSALKDDSILEEFYQSIIDSYEVSGNYLILLYHDAYDVMTKTKDNIKLDESEEVYEYIMCAICPVSLAKPGLGYFAEDKKIKARIRDWIVGVPVLGFTYPAFIDRSSDVNAIMYYTKNAKEPHPELMEKTLGCSSKQTATIQKETFQSIVTELISSEDIDSNEVYIKVQENLNTMVEEYNDMYEDTDCEPVPLSKKNMQNILIESGVSKEDAAKIEASFEEKFGEDIPLAESLIDSKLIKANEQKKKEEKLIKQVEVLESQLDEVKKQTEIVTLDEASEDATDEIVDTRDEVEGPRPNYDVVLHVKPEKVSRIKTEIINGQKCILIPIDEDEQATINGIENAL